MKKSKNHEIENPKEVNAMRKLKNHENVEPKEVNTMNETEKTLKNDIAELVFILDRSGSMGGLESDTIGGFNAMIEKQKKEAGRAYVTTVLFDNALMTIHDRIPLENVPAMTEKDYYVGGSTALLDAIGSTIRHIETVHRYIRPEDVPGRTIFVITTDGYENASHSFTRAKIKEMIQGKEHLGWEFLFLGANIDAISAAEDLGIRERNAVKFRSDREGTRRNYKSVGEAISFMRCEAKPLQAAWKEEIEEYEKNH